MSIRSFICLCVCQVRGIYDKVFHRVAWSFSSGVYLTNHLSESIHIWTIGTLEGQLSFHSSWPQGPCPRVHGPGWGYRSKSRTSLNSVFSTFLLWKQHMQIVGQTWLSLVTLTSGSWSKVCMTYISWSSDFLNLEDCLMYVHHTLGLWISMTPGLT